MNEVKEQHGKKGKRKRVDSVMYVNCQHLFASTHDTTPTPSADNRHGNRNNGIWQNNDAEIFQKDFSDVDSS